jgi:hypothetical protein
MPRRKSGLPFADHTVMRVISPSANVATQVGDE